jgi:hypothetical protein
MLPVCHGPIRRSHRAFLGDREQMLSDSVLHILLDSVILSGALILLNTHQSGLVGTLAATTVAGAILSIVEVLMSGRTAVRWNIVRFWLFFALRPSGAVWSLAPGMAARQAVVAHVAWSRVVCGWCSPDSVSVQRLLVLEVATKYLG